MSAKPIVAGERSKASQVMAKALRKRGLRGDLARRLEEAAADLSTRQASEILDSRPMFEDLARRSIAREAAHLELTFGVVNEIARATEKLGLARDGDDPDPFRRVWLQVEGGQTRMAGAIVRIRDAEVAVFLPPRKGLNAAVGTSTTMTYRAPRSTASYELRINDAVRLPGAQVVHLTRPDGQGAMGRGSVRCEVRLPAWVGASSGQEDATLTPCMVLDISAGGLKFEAETQFEVGDLVHLELPLEDGVHEPLAVRAGVRWAGSAEGDKQAIAVRFRDLSFSDDMRLGGYLRTLDPHA